MGGTGSGRFRSLPVRLTVEDTVRLPISLLKRVGLLNVSAPVASVLIKTDDPEGEEPNEIRLSTALSASGDPSVCLEYCVHTATGPQQVTEVVGLFTSGMWRSGNRCWFRCPSCERRVGVIFLPPGQQYFVCRTCHDLDYACRQGPRRRRKAGLRLGQD